jgi:hypothetical protein
MSEVPLYSLHSLALTYTTRYTLSTGACEDRARDGPASGERGSKVHVHTHSYSRARGYLAHKKKSPPRTTIGP